MEDKIKRLPLALFAGYFVKIMVTRQPTWIDGAIFVTLAGTAAFYEAWSVLMKFQELITRQEKLEADQKSVIEEMKEVNTKVSTIKLASTVTRMGAPHVR